MNRRVRVAVIGTGWWATATHLPALRADADVEIVALCDVSKERVMAAASAFNVPRTYTDHRTLLDAEQLDAVVVATTHATHFTIAHDCLEKGAHILIEKPMTLFAADARALTERAEQVDRSIVVGYPWNYAAHARQVRARLASGELGAIQFVQCVFNSYNTDLIAGKDRSEHPGGYPVHGPGDIYSKKEQSGGGHGHLQMTHAAGLLFFVTGLKMRSVQARMANHGLPLDLVNVMMVEFEGDALGAVSGTSNGFLPKSTLSIGCTQGSVEMDVSTGTTILRSAQEEPERLLPDKMPDLHYAPIRNLVGIARGVEETQSPAEIGWRAVELLDAAYRSAEAQGRPVSVEELYAERSKRTNS